MGSIASQITSLTIVYSAIYSGTDQRKHQSSASLAFVRGIHRGLVNSPHKWPVTRKMFPFDDVMFVVLCLVLGHYGGFPKFFRITSYYCPSACDITLMDMGELDQHQNPTQKKVQTVFIIPHSLLIWRQATTK